MLLIDCVESLSTHTLQKVLRHHPAFTIQSGEGSTLSFLLDPLYLHELWLKMTASERTVLGLFLTAARPRLLTLQRIEERSRLPKAEWLKALTSLRQKGIVFTHRRYYGEVAYFVPHDSKRAWMVHFVQLDSVTQIDMEMQQRSPSPFYEDLWSVLLHIRFSPPPLTQNGVIHKRYIPHLQACVMHVRDLDGLQFTTDVYSHYPKGLVLLLDFAIEHHLIGELENRLVVHMTQIKRWLSFTEVEREKALWEYVMDKLPAYDRSEDHLILEWVYALEMGKWVSWEVGSHFLRRLEVENEGHKSIDEVSIVPALQRLGLINQKCINGQQYIGRAFVTEHAPTQAYVQSNMQIMLPLISPPSVRWKVGEIAELTTYDQMLTYELTKASIERAVEIGWDSAKVNDFLLSIAVHIPGSVITTVQNWIKNCSKLRFLDVVLLEVSDEQLLHTIQSQPIFAPYLAGSLTSHHLLVYRDHVEQLRLLLEEAGYAPLKTITTYVKQGGASIPMGVPIVKGDVPIIPRVENIYPEWEDIFPEVRTIPKSWLGEPRTYHPSSLLDLLHRAIQLHLGLSLYLTDQTALERVHPLAVTTVGGENVLYYYKEVAEFDSHDLWIAIKQIEKVVVHLPY